MKNEIIIKKMLTHIEKALRYVSDMKYEDFHENEMVVEACVFNLSQLGELVNKLDEVYQREHKNIPWKQIYGLRNRIVHDYEGVNLKLIWEILKTDLPEMKCLLNDLLS